jgi:hypothetical protein
MISELSLDIIVLCKPQHILPYDLSQTDNFLIENYFFVHKLKTNRCR